MLLIFVCLFFFMIGLQRCVYHAIDEMALFHLDEMGLDNHRKPMLNVCYIAES